METHCWQTIQVTRPRDTRCSMSIWQTSLRNLLIATVMTGTLAGLFGPAILRTLRAWRPAPPQPPAVPVPAWLPKRQLDESDGYFESAETPLR